MKKRILTLGVLMVCLFILCACGKSQMVKDTEAAIEAIGAVTLDSLPAIEAAEKNYAILTDAEKQAVSNRSTLANARAAYDALPTATPVPTATPSPMISNAVAALKVLLRAVNNPDSVQVRNITRASGNDMFLFDISAQNKMGGTTRDEFVLNLRDDGTWNIVDELFEPSYMIFFHTDFTEEEIEQVESLAN